MTQPSAEDPQHRYRRALVRGAVVNALGLGAKLAYPLFFLVVTWFFGPAVMGLYLLTTFIGDLGSGLVSSGVADATTIFGSHHADTETGESSTGDPLYAVLANTFVLGVGGSILLIGITYLGAGWLADTVYPDLPGVAPALRLLVWGLPPLVFAQIAIAATKARMHMQYDAAIVGFGTPVLLLISSLAAWTLGAGLQGLIGAYVITQFVVAMAAAWAFSQHFDWTRLLTSLLRMQWNRRLLAFVLPQSLNMTFNRYLTRLDVMMLAAFGHSAAEVAFYGTAALITSNLRQVRLVFSSAFAPVAARHHHTGEMGALEATLGRVSRWTTTIIVPAVFLTVVLRDDLLRFVHESYVGDTRFMAVLLVAPLLSCALGLAGNVIIYTGHSTWTLANSVTVAGLNTGLNWILIPRFGLLGAASATAMATTCIMVLQMVELRLLEGVGLRWRYVYKPFIGLALGAIILAILWDPVTLPGFGTRLFLALGMVVLFAVTMAGIGHEEFQGVWQRFVRDRSP